MLSKMAQPNSSGGTGGTGGPGRGRTALSLGAGNAVARVQQQQSSSSNGRSNSPQNSNVHVNIKDIKKTNVQQQPQASVALSSSDEKKNQNGVTKPGIGKEKSSQNGNANTVKEVVEKKDTKTEKKEPKVEVARKDTEENASKAKKDEKESATNKKAAATVAASTDKPKKTESAAVTNDDVVVIEKDAAPSTSATATSERMSTRKATNQQQKSPSSKQSSLPAQKKQSQSVTAEAPAVTSKPPEDVDMEPLTVDASPIKKIESASSVTNTQPAATSTPGRSSFFGFKGNSKQTSEVELAAQLSNSPVTALPRSYNQITGRRSIRPLPSLSVSKVGSYRCINSDLDTSSCTNASMNATVGSEIPNSSSFSFSFFGRSRKRERTPPTMSGSQSATELAHDVDMSPPKRARFEILNSLATPFTMLRSRFSKASISTPARLRLEQTPPAGDEEGEVQNVSGIVIEEEQLNTSSQSNANELTVGQEAGLETPKKSGSPAKDDKNDAAEESTQEEGANRSRCAIM